MRKRHLTDRYFSKPYLELRKIVGFLAISLPLIVVLGGVILPPHVGLQSSISAYYHTEMRNVFVGILFATGVFLLTYNPGSYDSGYKGAPDRKFGIAAGLFAIFVAVFPTARSDWKSIIPPAVYDEGLYNLIHLVATTLLFSTLIYFSGVLFRKTAPGQVIRPGSKKALRNQLFYYCAVIMAICVSLILLIFILPENLIAPLEKWRPVFFLEFIAIWAFGVSWFVKGEALEYFRD